MRQPRHPGHDVADGVEAGLSRLHPFVGVEVAALQLGLGFLQPDAFRERLAAHRHQHHLGAHFLLLAVLGVGDADAGGALLGALEAGAGFQTEAALLELPFEFAGNFFIFVGDRTGQHFQDGDVSAESLVDGSKLHPHRAGTDDNHGLGHLLQLHHRGVGQDALAVFFQARQQARVRPRGQDDVLGFHLRLAVLADVNFDRAPAHQPPETLDGADLVLLHQQGQALGVLFDHLALAVDHPRPVELDARDLDAELARALDVVVDLRLEEQRLGGDAAHVQAGAAVVRLFFNQDGLQPVAGGAEGGGVAARPAADDCHVVGHVCHAVASSPEPMAPGVSLVETEGREQKTFPTLGNKPL